MFRYLDFQFSKVRANDPMQCLRYDEAWTTDISGYGVGFISKKYLRPETRLRFLIKGNAIIPVSDGVGKVVWCNNLPETPYFQTGLEFSMLFS